VIIPVLRSATRQRLLETDNRSECRAVKWKVCKSTIALYGLELSVTVARRENESNHLN
jgi:hypothetical protein